MIDDQDKFQILKTVPIEEPTSESNQFDEKSKYQTEEQHQNENQTEIKLRDQNKGQSRSRSKNLEEELGNQNMLFVPFGTSEICSILLTI